MPELTADRVAATIESNLGAECLLDDPGSYLVDGRPAKVAAAPADLDQLSDLLQLAHSQGWSVVPAGRGGWLDAGNLLRRADLVVTTRRLTAIRDHQPDDLVATVEAGVTDDELSESLARHGQWWPVDAIGGGTIGAILATRASGALATGYGTPRDLVLGVTAVLADGRVMRAGGRVVKNVAGYDMVKLLVGSWGTLGVLAEAHLRLYPGPVEDRTRLYYSTRAADLTAYALDLSRSGCLLPVAAEVLAPPTADRLGIEAAGWLMAVRWHGHPAAVAEATERADRIARELDVAGGSGPSPWGPIREIEARARPVLTLRVDVPVAATAEVIREARTFGSGQVPMILAAPFLGRVWLLVSADMWEDVGERAWALRIGDLRRHAAERGGFVRLERAPTPLRKIVDSWGHLGPAMHLHRGLKRKFDPQDLLNPGRFAGGL